MAIGHSESMMAPLTINGQAFNTEVLIVQIKNNQKDSQQYVTKKRQIRSVCSLVFLQYS